MRAFKRSQKQNIIKRILQVLTKYSLPNRTLVVDHINLLSRHVEAAGHPLILLNIWKGDSVDRVYEGLSTDEAPLIGIARNLKNHEGANSSLDALTALKRLVDITLRYALKISGNLMINTDSEEVLSSYYHA